MENRFGAILSLEKLRKDKQECVELFNHINEINDTVGLSKSTYDEIIQKINERLDWISERISNIKQNL